MYPIFDLYFLLRIAIALVRVTVAIYFLLAAWSHFQDRKALGNVRFPIVGTGMWIPIFAVVAEALIGAGLFLGLYTQAAAILGAIASAKFFFWKNRFDSMIPYPRSTSILLFILCLSLIIFGAGAFAFDSPL